MSFVEALAGSAIVLMIAAVMIANMFLIRWATRAPCRRWWGFIPGIVMVWVLFASFMWATSHPVK